MRFISSKQSEQHDSVHVGPLTARLARVGAIGAIAILFAGIVGFRSGAIPAAHAGTAPSAPTRLPIGYAGVDYYSPTDYFTHCPDFSWLQSSCYDNANLTDTPREQLISDLGFVTSHHVVNSMRVWISLDELMDWNANTGYSGFNRVALSNVDDMLSIFHQYGMRVVLVLYVYSSDHRLNEFRPQALDGNHPAMRSNYLRAVTAFMRHLGSNATDVAAAPIIELMNEPYFQLEEYFNSPSNLGQFGACDSSGRTDWGCVDQQIIHPWLRNVYAAAIAGSRKFLYSFSDTGRLFENYAYWSKMYPGNIINEHLYDSDPASHAAYYARALRFGKPWIVTEAGCDTGDIACTYSGSVAAAPDQWWIQNLRKFGAQSVMLDSHVTVWTYPDGPNSQTPTATGDETMNAVANRLGPVLSGPSPKPVQPKGLRSPSMANGFDHMIAGPLSAAIHANRSIGVVGGSRLTVQHELSMSAPNALAVSASGGGRAFLARYPRWTAPGFDLRLAVRLSSGFTTSPNGYTVLAQARTANVNNPADKVSIILGPNHNLFVTYATDGGSPSYLWSNVSVLPGRWYGIQLADDASTGDQLQLSIDHRVTASSTALGFVSNAVRFVAAGMEYSPPSAASQGTIYIDNLFVGA